jgi:beta-glucosidase
MKDRTYRYMSQEPLYPFGFGLSYTSFAYSNAKTSAGTIAPGESVEVSCTVTNTGEREGDEVVQLYLSDLEASVDVPRSRLVGFARIALTAGQSRTVSFGLSTDDMKLIDDQGRAVLEPGRFRLTIGGASPGNRGRELGAAEPAIVELELRG